MQTSKKPSGPIVRGLMSLCLLLSLTACGALPSKPSPSLPNAALYETDVPVPVLKENALQADLTRYVLELIEALGLANADRASLREWATKLKEKSNGNR